MWKNHQIVQHPLCRSPTSDFHVEIHQLCPGCTMRRFASPHILSEISEGRGPKARLQVEQEDCLGFASPELWVRLALARVRQY